MGEWTPDQCTKEPTPVNSICMRFNSSTTAVSLAITWIKVRERLLSIIIAAALQLERACYLRRG